LPTTERHLGRHADLKTRELTKSTSVGGNTELVAFCFLADRQFTLCM
jgi:hypothetical protein